MGKISAGISLDERDMRELDARAKARGVTRSAEVAHLLHERHGEEPPHVTIARLQAQKMADKRAAAEASVLAAQERARASIERTHYRQIMLTQKLESRERLQRASPPSNGSDGR